MKNSLRKFSVVLAIIAAFLASPFLASAQSGFNPNFIISDSEIQDYRSWTRSEVQAFLDSRGSYLRDYSAEDVNGQIKSAAEIIYDAAERYQINPKFILVTLQKEQSLITDDAPTMRQLEWATGYGVCDSCSTSDPNLARHRGFGRQVDNAAGVMRWYYQNSDQGYIKKKDVPVLIDGQQVIPQSWATAFLYTYTPHLHGNRNFWRIWDTWFSQVYPNGTVFKSASTSDYWLLQEGKRRRFASRAALITRADPRTAITVPEIEIINYEIGPEITFSNYSILQTSSSSFYLVDNDELRPFDSTDTVRRLGYNPQEFIETTEEEISVLQRGTIITASTTAPQGIIYQITDRGNHYYLLKDNALYPIINSRIIETNFNQLKVERHQSSELAQYSIAESFVNFKDGTLLKIRDMNKIYVIEQGRKRAIADNETFLAMGYKQSNVVTVDMSYVASIPEGEPIYLNNRLLSSANKFLGDNEAPVPDIFQTRLPAYLVAEYPSGRIIAGKNIDSRRPIASLTKLLTAYEAVKQNINLNKSTAYNARAHSSYGNPLKLQTGEKIRNRDLLNAVLVGSINNVSRMLAQAASANEQSLIASVNGRLERWGADNTTIADVTGLDENNKSTPRDILKIFTFVTENDTLKTALGKSAYSFRETLNKNNKSSHTVRNTNPLFFSRGLNYKILASKTGYTDEAGGVLAMLVESKANRQRYVVITMGDTNYAHRFDEPNRLAKWAAAGNILISGTN